MQQAKFAVVVVVLAAFAPSVHPADPPIRYMLHGGMTHEPPTEEYLKFVEQVKPDILVIGVFDQRLYATAFPSGKAKVQSPAELSARWKEIIDRLHRQKIRVIGQMEINVLSDRPADLAESTGFFGYYEKQWDEKTLGRRPAKMAVELLEEPDLDVRPLKKDMADATALCGCRVNPKALNACINKPGWREVQKRMVTAAVNLGVDGFMTNRNYFGHCACDHCRLSFRKWLTERFTADELKDRFGIADLAKVPLCVIGMHRDPETTPDELIMEKQRFIKHKVKEFFDEVYHTHGRSLKPDLFTAQWNHMANFDELHLDRGHLPPSTRTSFAHGAADERWSLPANVWGKDESLIWYCNWGTTQNTILDKEYAGDTVLYGKLIRALAAGKPYVVNKYDYYRPRNMMAEAAALGYATNALATPWQTEVDRETVLRYFAFLRKHESLFNGMESFAEIGLVFPRRAVHAGDASPLEYVESAGRTMIKNHVLFDILPDDLLSELHLEKYRVIVLSAAEYLEKAEREKLARYVNAGGKVLQMIVEPEDRARTAAVGSRALHWPKRSEPVEFAATSLRHVRMDGVGFLKELARTAGKEMLGHFDAPWTVEVHAYQQAASKRLIVHCVNYNHRENVRDKAVATSESPIAAAPLKMQLHLPKDFKAKSVRFISPDGEAESTLPFRQIAGTLEFETHSFLVYGICIVQSE